MMYIATGFRSSSMSRTEKTTNFLFMSTLVGRFIKPDHVPLVYLRESLHERLRALHAGEHELEVGKKRRLDLREVRVGGNVLERVGLGDRLVDNGVFFRREAAEHDAEESRRA